MAHVALPLERQRAGPPAAGWACAARPDLQPRYLRARPSAALAGHRQRARRSAIPTPRSSSSPARRSSATSSSATASTMSACPASSSSPDGDYRSLNLNLPLDEAVGVREAIILPDRRARFAPDLFIVDKEPTGFRGELLPALEDLQARGCAPRPRHPRRDGRAGPARPEWERKGAIDAADATITTRSGSTASRTSTSRWPALDLPDEVEAPHRLHRLSAPRACRRSPISCAIPKITKRPFILVTTGGGGDGDELIDWVISAYEADPDASTTPALIVFGPFINRDRRARPSWSASPAMPQLDAITFDTKIEHLMRRRPRSSRWAATTPSARSCRSTSAP